MRACGDARPPSRARALEGNLPREPIDIELRHTGSLAPAEFDEIWAVTERYVDTNRTFFEPKLRALPEVGLWRERGGALVGLVGLDVYPVEWEGKTATIIFTSSVVIDERFRGRNLVLKMGVRILLREKLRRPHARAYWFFDTFSYKSYLILSRNLTEFWPRRDQATPDGVARFVDHLAQRHYGDDWSPATGVVRRSGQKRLLPATALIDTVASADPDVSFFQSVNPGHGDGDMLVCLAPLSVQNLVGAICNALRRRPR
jgi:hypothetical protein